MIIKRLELQGFKSFPERTKIIFHPGITAVIGPNGTGKSNIIDAILWVLGGQRQKALRGEKTEDIIFNGNHKRPALSMAEVIMTLEEGNEELVISHRLFRSGESEYRLNGRPARLKDIQDALWKREVAEKEYFIIEQGSIGLLLTSKPQEKRQLLEEAAGTAFYKEKKKQAQSKLESSEQNLTRLEDILAEVARAKNSLARQAAAAQRYRRLREKVRELRSLVYLKKLNQLEEEQQKINLALQKCHQEESECLAQIKAAEKEISSLRQELWTLGQWLEAVKEEYHNLEARQQRLASEKQGRRIEYLEERKKQANEEIKQLEEEKEVMAQELHLIHVLEQDLARSLQEKLALYEQAKQESKQRESQLEEMSRWLQQTRDEHWQLISRLTEAKNEAGRWEKEMELSLKQESKQRQQIKETEERLIGIKIKIDQNQREIEEREKEKAQREAKLKEKKEQLAETSLEWENIHLQLQEKEKEKEFINYQIQAAKKVIQPESREKEAAPIPGHIGRLLDLIEVDPGFGRLADLCLGETAEALVVPVEALLSQESPSGEGTFYLLPLPGSKPELNLPDHPAVVGCLKEHLHPRDPLTQERMILADTIIVKNLKAALELWIKYPNYNYVTLQGEVLLSSGLLRTGPQSEGFFALKEEIRRLEKELNQKEEELKPLQEKKQEKEEAKKKLESEIEEEKNALSILEKRLRELDKEKGHLRLEESQLLSNQELFNQELEIILQERQSLQASLQEARGNVSLLTQEEAALKQKLQAGEQALAEEEKKNALQAQQAIELKALLEIEQEKKRQARSQAVALEERSQKVSLKIQSLRQQVELWEEEEKRLRHALQEVEEEIKSLRFLAEEKRREISEAEIKFNELRQKDEEKEKWLARQREVYEAKKEERIQQEIARTEVERDLANLEENCWQELRQTIAELRQKTPQKEMFPAEIEDELSQAEEELQKFRAVNLMAEEEYQQQKERYQFLLQQRDDLRASIDSTREAIQKIDEESQQQFLRAMEEINRNFQEVFSLLFRGGTAEVRLLDPDHPLESGAEIMAQPPGKKVQNINLLSGGEKSLASLAFLFSLFRTKPTPFCILDEVDAALDENNVSRFLDLMKRMKAETQFIIITHNYKTMEVADYIYGTTMEEPNVTRLYSVRLERKEESPSPS